MKKYSLFTTLIVVINVISAQNDMTFTTPYEKNNNYSASYAEIIAYYQALAKAYPGLLQLTAPGMTDIGQPLHTLILSADGDFQPASIRNKGKRILLINNGIHPGEPDGIDATMMLVRDYVQQDSLRKYLEHVVLVVIPVYNVDGCLNRGSFSRANQNGPESYGFRGNAKNLDLNRDFIKCDTRNAQSFNRIFTNWSPDIFIDNHVSNGADYPYTMTLIPTHPDKLEAPLRDFLNKSMLPALYAGMKTRNWEMTPYVNSNGPPDTGIYGFFDTPRYSTGYASLHHTIGFMPETHMLKPYGDRVRSTYALMDCAVRFINLEYKNLGIARKKAILAYAQRKTCPLDWKLDTGKQDTLVFKGYEAKYKPSEISGLPRLYYDRNATYEKQIPFWNTYQPSIAVSRPVAYIIPQAYQEVIGRLRDNGVELIHLGADYEAEGEVYFIKDYHTGKSPYEGHYPHSGVQVETKKTKCQFRKGDLVAYTNQAQCRFLVETLEPQAPDAFFAWNYFDGILDQKEYFSDYVFEDLAAAFLKEHPEVREKLDARKLADPEFAKSASAQLDFVYRLSPWYEPTSRRYPVVRLLGNFALPLAE